MNIYYICQDVTEGRDVFDQAIVVAENEHQAARIHPRSDVADLVWSPGNPRIRPHWCEGLGCGCLWKDEFYGDLTWADPNDVTVELVGTAVPNEYPRVVVASIRNW